MIDKLKKRFKRKRRFRILTLFSGIALAFLCALQFFQSNSTRRRLSGGEVECNDSLDEIMPLAIPVYFFLLIISFVGVGVVTDDWFVPALSLISKELNLSEDVAGATFMASASSAPELFTSLVDTFWSKSSIGIGTIVGSAVFNILVIIACSGAFSDSEQNPNGLDIDWRPLFRDIAFYLISIYEMVQFIYLDRFMGGKEGQADWWEGLAMFSTYILYVIYMAFNKKIQETLCSREGDEFGEEEVVYFQSCVVTGLPPRLLRGAGFQKSRLVEELDTKIFARYHLTSETCPTFILLKLPNESREFYNFHNLIKRDVLIPLQKDIREFLEWEDYSADIQVLALDASSRTEIQTPKEEAEGEEIHQKFLDRDDSSSDDDDDEEEGMLDWFGEVLENCWNTAFGLTIANCKVEEPLIEIEILNDVIDQLKDKKSRLEQSGAHQNEIGKVDFAIDRKTSEQEEFIDELQARESKYINAFLQVIVWIGIISFAMVFFAQKLGCLIGIPPIIMGVTILAAGTSIPDAFASIAAAKSGLGNMAVANAIGSNVFDILIGLGLPWFLHGIVYQKPYEIDTEGIIVQICILAGTVFFILAAFIYTGWVLNKFMGSLLLAGYAAFAIYSILDNYLG